MVRSLPVLINRGAGEASSRGIGLADQINRAFRACDCRIDLHVLDGDEMAAAVRHYAFCPRVVVGGGDGTLSSAAAELVGEECALGILPLGTRNHFARQLGVPLDLDSAVRAAVTGLRKRIDVASAASRIFVNNASFGLYSRFVRLRRGSPGPQ